jgi:hypothetical protein
VPDVPEGLGNRPAALWEPLFAIADAAGGPWPALARQACVDLESPDLAEDEDEEAGYRTALNAWAVKMPADQDEDA